MNQPITLESLAQRVEALERLVDEASETGLLVELKSDPGQLGLETLLREISKLTMVRALNIPADLFEHVSPTGDGHNQLVVLETKGLHLEGSKDTDYKRALLERLSAAYRDERTAVVGKLTFDGPAEELVCDLVFDEAWRGVLERRYFGAVDA